MASLCSQDCTVLGFEKDRGILMGTNMLTSETDRCRVRRKMASGYKMLGNCLGRLQRRTLQRVDEALTESGAHL